MLNKNILLVFLGYMLFSTYEQAEISIEVQDTVIEYGKTDVNIRCVVNGTSLQSITVIQLKRSETNIVSEFRSGVDWQDKKLQTRSEVNASLIDINTAYLHFKIKACAVNDTIDQDTYQCVLFAFTKEGTSTQQVSAMEYLNITGYIEEGQYICAGIVPSHAVLANVRSFFLIMHVIAITCFFL